MNVLGTIYGVKAILPTLIEQGGGTIINVASIEAVRGMPYHSAYSASKHAIKGSSEALRVELAHERRPVRVVLIEPAAINTPFFVHSRFKLGVKPLPFPRATRRRRWRGRSSSRRSTRARRLWWVPPRRR